MIWLFALSSDIVVTKNIYRIKKWAFSCWNGCSWVVGGVEDEQLGGQQRGCQVAWVLAAGLKLDPRTALRAQGWNCGSRYSPASQQHSGCRVHGRTGSCARAIGQRSRSISDCPSGMWDLDRRAAGCRRLVLQVGAMARPGPAGWREGAGRPRVLQVGDAAGGDTRALQVPTHGSRRSWKLGFVIDTSTMLSTFVSDLFVRTCKNNHLITWLVDLLPISSEMQIRKTWLIFLIRGLRTITWTWLIVFFWFHQRCESGIAQSFWL